MSAPLQFRSAFVRASVPGEGVFLLSESVEQVIRGQVYVRVAEAMNGHRSLEDIVELLRDDHTPAEVIYVVEALRRGGYICAADPNISAPEAAFWDQLGGTRQTDPPNQDLGTIAIQTIGTVELGPVEHAVHQAGLRIDAHSKLVLVVTDDYLQPELAAWDRNARAEQRTWLLAKPAGVVSWIGPIITPEQTGCWACLAHRLRGHRKVQRYLQTKFEREAPYVTARAATAASLQLGLAMASAELHKWQRTGESRLRQSLITFDHGDMETTRHTITARPQCPHCGEPELIAQTQRQAIEPAARPAELADGGRRHERAAETLERLDHHLSPITGIVSALRRTSEPDSALLYAYSTDHNFVHMTENLYFLRSGLRSHSGGKGRSDVQAKTSALCESIERYSSVYQGDEAKERNAFAELVARGRAVVHPNDCLLYSPTQLAEAEQWRSTGELFMWVPDAFDEHAEIDWSPAWSLSEQRQVQVATGYCFYGAPSPFMRSDSNGCAAGNSLEEAILQGYLELIERDAVAIWWYNQLRRPGVDLASFNDPYFNAVIEHYQSRGRDFWVLELPTDFSVRVFAALSRNSNGAQEQITFGFGAHFDAQLAINRAITEHNQFVPFIPIIAGDPGLQATIGGRWHREARCEDLAYLRADHDQGQRCAQDYAQADKRVDLRTEIMRCVDEARALGMETLVQNHTRPDTGLHVAKVIVPGLRHFWPRLGPGRLYDVPVQLGLVAAPTRECDLNPYPVFI